MIYCVVTCFCNRLFTLERGVGLSKGSWSFCEDVWMLSPPYRPLAGGVLYSPLSHFLQSSAGALVSPLFFHSWNGWFDFRFSFSWMNCLLELTSLIYPSTDVELFNPYSWDLGLQVSGHFHTPVGLAYHASRA